jgi:hypothetical protein
VLSQGSYEIISHFLFVLPWIVIVIGKAQEEKIILLSEALVFVLVLNTLFNHLSLYSFYTGRFIFEFFAVNCHRFFYAFLSGCITAEIVMN